jgi:glycosyltransferase involved in cell wall biosynthesis
VKVRDPLVSVLIPARDAAATLDACLGSVARQSEPRFECVIVDDGSADATLECARAWSIRDARFRVVPAPREGLVPALRRGVRACRAPRIARMDADDWMHRDRLTLQIEALERQRLAAVGSHVRLFPRRDLGPGMRAYEAWLTSIDSPRRVREEAFVECPVAHPTLMLRRDVLAALPYRDVAWPEDYDLVLRMLAAGHRVGVVPRRLVGWRQGEARLSRTHPRYATDRFTECKAAFLVDGFLAAHGGYLLWGYGRTGRELARALRAHGRHPTSIVELHPGRIGRSIQGARVVSRAHLGAPPRPPLLVSVAGAPARAEIRAELARFGFRECVDYVCAA